MLMSVSIVIMSVIIMAVVTMSVVIVSVVVMSVVIVAIVISVRVVSVVIVSITMVSSMTVSAASRRCYGNQNQKKSNKEDDSHFEVSQPGDRTMGLLYRKACSGVAWKSGEGTGVLTSLYIQNTAKPTERMEIPKA